MTTETNPQVEAKRIWDQLDAQDSGDAVATEELQEATAEQAAAETPEATQQQEPQQSDEDPKVLREKLAGMEAIVQQLQGRLRNAEGHIGGLSSQLKQQHEAAKAVQAAGGDAPTAKELREAQGDPEAMRKLAEDYPEFAAAISPAIDAAVTRKVAELEQRFQQSHPQQDSSQMMAELERTRAELTVEVRHPGWKEKVKRPEFIGWLQQGPREVQMLAASPEPADAVRLLDLYETARGGQAKPNQRLNAAAALPTGRTTGVRQKSIDDMTPQELWAYFDQIDKQKG
jgi:hypothetical protein